jgi:hypothetical protein
MDSIITYLIALALVLTGVEFIVMGRKIDRSGWRI